MLTGLGCGLVWLALCTVLRLLGTQDPTAPSIVSIAAPAILFVAIWILTAIKQRDTPNQLIWTWVMVNRKLVIVLMAILSASAGILAAVAVYQAAAAGRAEMIISLAVILAHVGAVLGGFIFRADLTQWRNLRK